MSFRVREEVALTKIVASWQLYLNLDFNNEQVTDRQRLGRRAFQA